jgi:adenylyltransferase/sulfurtransferase
VGALKVEAAKKRLTALNPEVEVVCLPERLDATTLDAAIAEVDVVLDGTDNFAARFAVSRACVARRVPLVSGAAVRVEGQIAVFLNRGDGPCYSCLYNDEDEWLGDCQGNGVLAPVPGVIGTLMAEEAQKLVLGWQSSLHNRLLLWDAKRGEWQSVALKKDPKCAVCGRGASS